MRWWVTPLLGAKPLLTMRLLENNAPKFGRKFVFSVKISIFVT